MVAKRGGPPGTGGLMPQPYGHRSVAMYGHQGAQVAERETLGPDGVWSPMASQRCSFEHVMPQQGWEGITVKEALQHVNANDWPMYCTLPDDDCLRTRKLLFDDVSDGPVIPLCVERCARPWCTAQLRVASCTLRADGREQRGLGAGKGLG